VSGVGGAVGAAAEAILLFDRAEGCKEGSVASAAFLFLDWEEMVSTVWVCFWECPARRDFQVRAREAMGLFWLGR
jgi:hypothetical protein